MCEFQSNTCVTVTVVDVLCGALTPRLVGDVGRSRPSAMGRIPDDVDAMSTDGTRHGVRCVDLR
jgi:hypothetical protein